MALLRPLLPAILAVGTAAMATTTKRIHFNNAGASPSPPTVTDAIIQHLRLEAEVGGYRAADLANVDGAYDSVAKLIGAGRDAAGCEAREEIALVESATVGWTRAFYGMLETKERELMELQRTGENEDDARRKEAVILVSEAEYAANLVAAVKFARDRSRMSKLRWRVLPIPSSTIQGEDGETISSGVVDLQAFRSMLVGTYAIDGDERCIDPASIVMVCVTHIPTNSGIVNPVDEIGGMIDAFNSRHRRKNNESLPQILYLVDACQSAGQLPIDVRQMKCHALTATGRKYLRGPRGTGFLYVSKHIANALEPSHVDHAAAPVMKVVDPSAWDRGLEGAEDREGLRHAYKPGTARFEFWESNVAARLGLGAAVDVALSVGVDAIEEKCAMLGRLLRARLREMEGVHVYHDGSSECGIVTFYVDNVDAATIKKRMQNGVDDEDAADNEPTTCCSHISVVPAPSTPLDSSRTRLGERSLLRASLSYFNTEEEISSFCKALLKCMKSL